LSQIYLLAAGRGKRAGGPKAWQDCNGEPLLKKQIDFLLTRVDPQRITVSIQADWVSQCRRLCENANWVPADPEAPAMDSLIRLLKAVRMIKWSFIYHVDQPVWETKLFDALHARTPGAQADAFVPVYQGRRGHPVLVSHGLWPDLLALDPKTDRLDEFLKKHRVEEVPVEFSCILENWNDGAPRK
jgi:CTP:molybdopterin cytidylyltransferase MocA